MTELHKPRGRITPLSERAGHPSAAEAHRFQHNKQSDGPLEAQHAYDGFLSGRRFSPYPAAAASPIRPLTTVAGSGTPFIGQVGGTTMIGGGAGGGTTIVGGGGGGENGGGGTSDRTCDGAGGDGGPSTTTGVEDVDDADAWFAPHTGGKKASACGDHTANGSDVTVTVTAGRMFFSFLRN